MLSERSEHISSSQHRRGLIFSFCFFSFPLLLLLFFFFFFYDIEQWKLQRGNVVIANHCASALPILLSRAPESTPTTNKAGMRHEGTRAQRGTACITSPHFPLWLCTRAKKTTVGAGPPNRLHYGVLCMF
ncbi:hypothetical protein L209DRAFT_120953 [Thermothelomyces heterothallicus CBS 203.75]